MQIGEGGESRQMNLCDQADEAGPDLAQVFETLRSPSRKESDLVPAVHRANVERISDSG